SSLARPRRLHRKRSQSSKSTPGGFAASRSLLSADLSFSENHFALAHELVVQPQAVLIRGRFAARTWRAAEQPHAGRRLKNVRRKWTPVHIEFHAQIACVGDPGHLVGFVDHDDLRDESNEYGAFSHFSVWPLPSGTLLPGSVGAQGR